MGYGLTEASPGLALGRPGEWAPYCLGRPLGCQVRLGDHGDLQFRGPNACIGVWSDGHLQSLDPDRWVETGDLVDIRGEELFYRGRLGECFKLSNGRWIDAGAVEAQIRNRFPAIDEALIFSPEGEHLAIAWSGGEAVQEVETTHLRTALGSLGPLLRWSVRIPEESWTRTTKGAIDRRASEGRLVCLIPGSTEEHP